MRAEVVVEQPIYEHYDGLQAKIAKVKQISVYFIFKYFNGST